MADLLIAVNGLAKRYGAKTAIADLSLELAEGEILALLGANGGGKTTSLRLLAGLLAPDTGDGVVLGADVRRRPREIRRRVGYLPQSFSLHPSLTVAENLRFRAEVYDIVNPARTVSAAIEEYDLGRFAGARADALSGGWARRLQLAAALIHQPRLVLLDEPTAGLDALARQEIWRRLARLTAAGVGLVISTHDLADAERCGRALLLLEGRIVATGTPAELAAQTPALTFILTGRALDSDQVEAISGVISCHPTEQGLRVLAAARAEPQLDRLAAERDGALTPIPPRLEDAVLARIHGAS
jgi:ABC-2 type transport system ATP-binding protein